MKTLKLMLAGLILFFAASAASAAVKQHSQPSQTDVVNIYINAITNGKTEGLDKILDNDMQFNLQRGQRTNTLDKDQLVSYLKGSAVLNQTVNTTTTIMQNDGNWEKVKIEFKYDGYVRTDIVTLGKSFGWKITNINSTFS